MISYSQMHRTDKYSQHSSIIWSVWSNGWAFVYELIGCGFESCCCPLGNSHFPKKKSNYCSILAATFCRYISNVYLIDRCMWQVRPHLIISCVTCSFSNQYSLLLELQQNSDSAICNRFISCVQTEFFATT